MHYECLEHPSNNQQVSALTWIFQRQELRRYRQYCDRDATCCIDLAQDIPGIQIHKTSLKTLLKGILLH